MLFFSRLATRMHRPIASAAVRRVRLASYRAAVAVVCLGVGTHLVLLMSNRPPNTADLVTAYALDPQEDPLGTTVTGPGLSEPEVSEHVDPNSKTPEAFPGADGQTGKGQGIGALIEDGPSTPAATEEDPAPSPTEDRDEGPTGPDTTMAEATGMPVAGGTSADPMDALLQALATYQDTAPVASVIAFDEATGHVVYELAIPAD